MLWLMYTESDIMLDIVPWESSMASNFEPKAIWSRLHMKGVMFPSMYDLISFILRGHFVLPLW